MAPLLESLPHLPAAAARSPSPIAPSSPCHRRQEGIRATAYSRHPRRAAAAAIWRSLQAERRGEADSHTLLRVGGLRRAAAPTPQVSPVASPSRRAPAAPSCCSAARMPCACPRRGRCRFFKGQFVRYCEAAASGATASYRAHAARLRRSIDAPGRGHPREAPQRGRAAEPVPDEGFQYCRGQVMQWSGRRGCLSWRRSRAASSTSRVTGRSRGTRAGCTSPRRRR